jgi:Mg2+/Co2+ transporter CorC
MTCHANTQAVLNGIMEVAEFPQREIAFVTRTAVTFLHSTHNDT